MCGIRGTSEGAIHRDGLSCVTVLIGVHDRASGLPVGGIINQPFAVFSEESQRYITVL